MDNGTNSGLILYRDMRSAIRNGDYARFSTLVAGHHEVLAHDDWATELLRLAASKNQVDMVALLVANGADINAGRGERSPEGAIDNAACNNAIDVAKWMLKHGAVLNQNVEGKTRCFPLTGAIHHGNFEMVKLLVEHGADINAYWADETPLSFAINYGQKEIEAYLRSKGALEPWQIRGEPPPQPPAPATFIGHLEQHLGLPEKLVLHEIVPSDDPPIVIQPVRSLRGLALVTQGMSDRAMHVPPGAEEYRYAELILYLPEEWPIEGEESLKPENLWPINWMRSIARYPHQHKTWLGGPSAVIASGEPPQPLAPNTQLTCWLLLEEPGDLGTLTLPDGRTVHFYAMYALHTSEREFEEQHGIAALIERFQASDVSPVLDLTRPPVA